ncbi:hypothetical protein L291_1898 [Acinetobacter guillouiae MSP4-18]|nr:hypothetical protein L291_1898 [Acinetobacter guillouiae MSP4-18]BAP38397.1 hypothetical protein AS4_34570 [Acinetobacter guillouiae]
MIFTTSLKDNNYYSHIYKNQFYDPIYSYSANSKSCTQLYDFGQL